MSAAASELPNWAQMAIWIATTIVTIAVVIHKGWKKSDKEEPVGTATVVAGSFADKRALEALTDELIDLRRTMGEMRSDVHRDVTIVVTDVRELTKAVRTLTDLISERTKEVRRTLES